MCFNASIQLYIINVFVALRNKRALLFNTNKRFIDFNMFSNLRLLLITYSYVAPIYQDMHTYMIVMAM